MSPEENLQHLYDEVFYLTEGRWPLGVARLDLMPQFFELCRAMEVPFDFFQDSQGYPAWSHAPLSLAYWVGGGREILEHRQDLLRNWFARYFGERQPLPAKAARVVEAMCASADPVQVGEIYREYKQALLNAGLSPEARFWNIVVSYDPEYRRWYSPSHQPACEEEALDLGAVAWRIALQVNSVNDR